MRSILTEQSLNYVYTFLILIQQESFLLSLENRSGRIILFII